MKSSISFLCYVSALMLSEAFTVPSTGRGIATLRPPSLVSPDMISDLTVHADTISAIADSASVALSDSSVTLSDNIVLNAILTEERPWQYWFMFPVVLAIAICCQFAGIGGAAVLSPLTLLVFPLMGPEYPLPSAAAAIASALLSEVFGFTSGLSGYWRRGLVDWGVASRFLILSMPFALVGALTASTVASNPQLLRAVYAALMIGLSAFLFISERPEELSMEECELDDEITPLSKTASDGTVYNYIMPKTNTVGASATSVGAALTGLLGVGIGEVVLPQLIRLGCMPQPVAAGTSVAVVVMTAFTAAIVQFLTLAAEVTNDTTTMAEGLVQVIPWNFVQFTIPAAVIGGQIASFLASKQAIDEEVVEKFAAGLFGFIGIAFTVKCITG